MITCRVCGAQNEAEAVFCGVCGNRLDAAAGTTDAPAASETAPADDVVVPTYQPPEPAAASREAASESFAAPISPVIAA